MLLIDNIIIVVSSNECIEWNISFNHNNYINTIDSNSNLLLNDTYTLKYDYNLSMFCGYKDKDDEYESILLCIPYQSINIKNIIYNKETYYLRNENNLINNISCIKYKKSKSSNNKIH